MPAPPPAAVTAWRRSWDGPPLPSRQMPTITSRLGIAHATRISYCRLGVAPKSASHSPLVLQAKGTFAWVQRWLEYWLLLQVRT